MAGRNDRAKARALPAAALVSLMLLVACGGFDPRAEGALEGFTAEEIYQRGEYELANRQSDNAAFYFGEIERLYP